MQSDGEGESFKPFKTFKPFKRCAPLRREPARIDPNPKSEARNPKQTEAGRWKRKGSSRSKRSIAALRSSRRPEGWIQIRNPNIEIRNKPVPNKIPNPENQKLDPGIGFVWNIGFVPTYFEFVSNFGFRASDFGFGPNPESAEPPYP
jgi:hypothetical protein